MMLEITTPTGLKLWRQTTQLEGVEYSWRFWWSDRESAFYVDIGDTNGNPIAPFIRLVLGASLLRRFKTDPRVPQGLLFLTDLTGVGADIQTPDELGQRVVLGYVTSDDPILQGA